MFEIIPAIIVKTRDELESKIKLIEPHTNWVQIDIDDGKFVPNITLKNPREIKAIIAAHPDLKFELHLLIMNPEETLVDWIGTGARRIIVHIEATSVAEDIIEAAHEAGMQIGLALNPETAIEAVSSYLDQIEEILFLSVHPGFSGRPFIPEVIEKIIEFHNHHPKMIIGIDGGINLKTIHLAARAGVNRFYAQSVIFNAKDIGHVFELLTEEAEKALQE